MTWRPLAALLALGAVVVPGLARAKLCGDDVRGQDVPCACGDTVVSDLVLGDDPVAALPCPQDGLIVRAPGAPGGVRIDLHGKTIRGSGSGTGVWVVSGGPGGARIVSSGGAATIEGFRDGIVAQGPDTVALVDGVSVSESKRDGIRVSSKGFAVRNAAVRGSGRDGFALAGERFQLAGTRAADSGRYGYYVMGNGASLGEVGAGTDSHGSGEAGFHLMGMGHRLVDCTAAGGHKDGVHLHGMDFEIRGCAATDNQGSGIAGMAPGTKLVANHATGNGGDGIEVGGPGVEDGGGNAGSGNRGQGHQRPAAQCEIGGVACRR